MAQTRTTTRDREAIAREAFHQCKNPYREALEKAGPLWSAWYASWIGFSVAMNMGLGAFLGSVGYATLAGVIGTVGVVSGVVGTLAYGAFLLARDHRVHLNLAERVTRDRFIRKIMESQNVKSARMAAAHVLFSRAEALNTTTEDTSEASLFKKPFIVDNAIEKSQRETEGQYKYTYALAREIAQRGGINFWFKAARSAGLDRNILAVALRGLSPIVYSDRLREGRDEILEKASWKQKGLQKCPPRPFVRPDEDVPFFCLSYKHKSKTQPLDATELMGALRDAQRLALKLYGKRCFRIWIDQLVFGSMQEWVGVGLMPYLLFPTVFAKGSKEAISSSWICLEKICAQLITGGDVGGNETWTSVASSNTLLESVSAVAEIVSKQREGNTTIRRDDLSYLQMWAKGVLYGKMDDDVYGGVREEIGAPWNLSDKKKMHYVALLSVKVQNNSALTNYYAQRTRNMWEGGWHIKNIFFEEEPKIKDWKAVKEITTAVVIQGSDNALVLVTQFSNLNMYTYVTVAKQGNGMNRVRQMQAISEVRAMELGVYTDQKVETVKLESLC